MIIYIAARHIISKFVSFFSSKKLLSSRFFLNTIAQSSLNQILEFHQAVSTSDKSECIGKQDRISSYHLPFVIGGDPNVDFFQLHISTTSFSHPHP